MGDKNGDLDLICHQIMKNNFNFLYLEIFLFYNSKLLKNMSRSYFNPTIKSKI